jgi:type I site-specific restriction endonuclease
MQRPEEYTRKTLIDPILKEKGWDFEPQIIEEEPYE